MSIVSDIIAFETGELDDDGVIDLFQRLIDSGMAWRLQGSYGRMAAQLIEAGVCTVNGQRANCTEVCEHD